MAKTLEQELAGLRQEEVWGAFESWADDNTRAVVIDRKAGKVIKRFRGESAWSDANRDASDRYMADKYGK
jgi:hypothetical protein